MASGESEKRSVLRVAGAPPPRHRRRQLPKPVRYLIIAAIGAMIALLAFFLLRTVGY